MKKKKFPFTEEQCAIVDKEREVYPSEVYASLHRQGLSKEEEAKLLDEFHDDLYGMMYGKYLDEYYKGQAKKQEGYKLGFVRNFLWGTNFVAISSIGISSFIITGGALPLAAAIALGVGGIIKFGKAVVNKLKLDKSVQREQEVELAWEHSKDSLADVMDFYKCNDLKPVLYPFSPLKLEGVMDCRKDKTELISPVSVERIRAVLAEKEKQISAVTVETEQ